MHLRLQPGISIGKDPSLFVRPFVCLFVRLLGWLLQPEFYRDNQWLDILIWIRLACVYIYLCVTDYNSSDLLFCYLVSFYQCSLCSNMMIYDTYIVSNGSLYTQTTWNWLPGHVALPSLRHCLPCWISFCHCACSFQHSWKHHCNL